MITKNCLEILNYLAIGDFKMTEEKQSLSGFLEMHLIVPLFLYIQSPDSVKNSFSHSGLKFPDSWCAYGSSKWAIFR